MSKTSQNIFSHKGVRWVTAGWIGFITENLVLSHNREWIINNFGNDNYHITYNILSTIACSSIGYGFFKLGKVGGPYFARRSMPIQVLGFAFQSVGFIGFSQLAPAIQLPVGFGSQPPPRQQQQQITTPESAERKLYVRCPIDFRQRNPDGAGLYGVDRVTRHPALWFLGLSCFGSAITTVYVTHAVMFSFPLLFALIGTEHQDYRYRRGNGGSLTPEMEAQTSNIPFAALVCGKQSFATLANEMKWTNAGIATAIAFSLATKRLRVKV